ncbi:low affinity inorganic phosphate transporter 1-like [Eucalyptus grandis]|uniref:low affinity inorganic phosphate transporter 1-like n=1 Tax=Eucalyptus grandis TaxID=71139 RepID=UPI0005249F3E|nr:low affinity inorganic phosphate transporter 1-like [Eucalyptus grandis]
MTSKIHLFECEQREEGRADREEIVEREEAGREAVEEEGRDDSYEAMIAISLSEDSEATRSGQIGEKTKKEHHFCADNEKEQEEVFLSPPVGKETWGACVHISTYRRFAIQLLGLFFMTVFMFALAIPYHHWTLKANHIGFVIMHLLTFFFTNFRPNATTFVAPAEIFPARLQSTCHGISAACGKAGTIIGAFGFLYAAQGKVLADRDVGYPPCTGVNNSSIMLGVINFLGMLFTLLVPESKGKSLQELMGENEVEPGQARQPQEVSAARTVPE